MALYRKKHMHNRVFTPHILLLIIFLIIIPILFSLEVVGYEHPFYQIENGNFVIYSDNRSVILNDGLISVQREEDQLLHFKTKAGCGIVFDDGDIIFDLAWTRVFAFHGSSAVVWGNGKYGVIDRQGNIVVPLIYNSIVSDDDEGITHGRYFVSENGAKYMLIDNHRNIIRKNLIFPSPMRYPAFSFSEGLASIMLDNGKYTYIDYDGQEVFGQYYDAVSSFHQGYAAVMVEQDWYVINRSGEFVASIGKCNSAYVSSSGILVVDYLFEKNHKLLSSERAGDYLYAINEQGIQPLNTSPWSRIEVLETDNTSPARFLCEGQSSQLNDWFLIDECGQNLGNYAFSDADIIYGFDCLLSLVRLEGNKYGAINIYGDWVVAPDYGIGSRFFKGKAVFAKEEQLNGLTYYRFYLCDNHGKKKYIGMCESDKRGTMLENMAEYYGCNKGYEAFIP